AEHSWRLALMTFIIASECKVKLDLNRAMALALLHDLAEAKTGDIDAYKVIVGEQSLDEKAKNEKKAMREMTDDLSFGDWIYSLWNEYEQQESVEAKFVHALDKIEAFLHIAERGVKAYIPKEFHADYADKAVEAFDEATRHFPEVRDLLEMVKTDLKQQFEAVGVAWVQGKTVV
ncbi:HD domain-containing protein, partial [archaeon]|nr:HD domain-containing protein [archaeon]